MYVIVSARMKTSSMSEACFLLSQFFNGHFCSCPYNEVTGSVSVFVCLSVCTEGTCYPMNRYSSPLPV